MSYGTTTTKRIVRMSNGKKKIEITKDIIDFALNPSIWELGNDVLYSLCRKYPRHDRANAIVAKIWLIGRAYAASIERRKNKNNISSDYFYENNVVKEIQGSQIDEWLDKAKDLSGAISVHKQLMDIFYSITNLSKRSLASKYLHFHKPDLFYIYDSRASTAIKKVCPDIKNIEQVKVEKADEEYLNYCRRCLWLKGHIQKIYKKELTPRQIDNILLQIAQQ